MDPTKRWLPPVLHPWILRNSSNSRTRPRKRQERREQDRKRGSVNEATLGLEAVVTTKDMSEMATHVCSKSVQLPESCTKKVSDMKKIFGECNRQLKPSTSRKETKTYIAFGPFPEDRLTEITGNPQGGSSTLVLHASQPCVHAPILEPKQKKMPDAPHRNGRCIHHRPSYR